jgi:hypothetical protein
MTACWPGLFMLASARGLRCRCRDLTRCRPVDEIYGQLLIVGFTGSSPDDPGRQAGPRGPAARAGRRAHRVRAQHRRRAAACRPAGALAQRPRPSRRSWRSTRRAGRSSACRGSKPARTQRPLGRRQHLAEARRKPSMADGRPDGRAGLQPQSGARRRSRLRAAQPGDRPASALLRQRPGCGGALCRRLRRGPSRPRRPHRAQALARARLERGRPACRRGRRHRTWQDKERTPSRRC